MLSFSTLLQRKNKSALSSALNITGADPGLCERGFNRGVNARVSRDIQEHTPWRNLKYRVAIDLFLFFCEFAFGFSQC